ncbi:MAG: response regulator [Eubacteriales bacterium]|nr:response regulator [Eubacteriales bacterium]
MLKVFLVEDEAIIREGLRDSIPWQQYGYTFVGTAGDGEQALPMLHELQPDVLITDIKMPFMDGLALSKLVAKEFPKTRIIIISGYDDFEYARQAVGIGVEQYLLKPISKAMLIKTLQEVQEKIQSEREQENYMEKFRSEVQEYEQFSRRRLFEEIVAGQLSVEEIYERAGQLSMDIHAPCYNLVLYSLQAKNSGAAGTGDSLTKIRDELLQFLLEYPEYLPVRQNLTTYAVLIKGDREQVEMYTARCIEMVRNIASDISEADWHVASGTPVTRLSSLPECYAEVSRMLSYRHLLVNRHILTKESIESMTPGDEESSLKNLDMAKIDPAILRGFLQNGQPQEVEGFVTEYIRSLRDAAKSKLFCQYLMLNVRFTAIAYVESLGYTQEEFLDSLECLKMTGQNVSTEELHKYITEMLSRGLEMREKETMSKSRSIVSQAVAYIDEHYADENISLGEVAGYTNVSANYFSAVFSQEMQQTFVEYLTGKRMEKARELLRKTDKRSAEIALEVGYKDPHYFSFVFRKTQGCTPRDYRTGGKRS